MAYVSTELIRNVVLLSHSGAGKTILSESLLNQTGVTNRIGTVEDGTTTSDFEPEEAKRGNSVQTSIMHAPWRDHKINILDTPGYADYRGEVVSGIRVADSAVIVVSAPAGIEVGTAQMWQMADEHNLPRIVYISKMDRENADFDRTLEALTERFGRHLVPLQVPIGVEAEFSGVINLLAKDVEIPDGMQDAVDAAMERLTEAVAEIDDALADKYLEGEDITETEIRDGLIKGVRDSTLVPVLAGSPPNTIGVNELLDVITDYMPSPADAGTVSATTATSDDETALACNSNGPLAALVFKTAADPFVGRLSYFRVYSGIFKSDSHFWNSNKGEAERIGQVYEVNGKQQDGIDSLAAGDIGAVSRLNSVVTGDTISTSNDQLLIKGLDFPNPVHQMAVSPKTKADIDKMTSSLARIVEEDPSLIVSRDEQTLEILMKGLGDTHLDVAIEKMKRKFGVELEMSIPRVPYMETISRRARVEYRHKKQSGGHGQFGHVWLEVEPLPRGSGFEFAQSIVGGVVPREYIPAVEKGVRGALDGGVVAGFPVIDFKATLVDGSFHAVDSSGVSFEIAAGHAATKGMEQAGPVLLEPIMKVDITVPDEFTGDIIGDLNGRRGRIQGMIPNGNGTTTINCEAPRAEMLTYATELRSQTQGQGSFTMDFDHYEDVPLHMLDQVVQEITETVEAT
jgi:elongation factor G